MTGTGTQADPFIIDTYDELLTKAAIAETYIEFNNAATTKTIDINNTEYKTGETGLVIANGVHISGNGWTIRNIYAVSGHSAIQLGSGIEIKGLNLLNITQMGANVPLNNTSNTTYSLFKECKLSIMKVCGNLAPEFCGGSIKFEDCSLNLKNCGGFAFRSSVTSYSILVRCNVNIDFSLWHGEVVIISEFSKVSDCKFTGTVKLYSVASPGCPICLVAVNTDLNSSVFCVTFTEEYHGTSTGSIFMLNNVNPTSACLVDQSLLPETFTIEDTYVNVHYLTTNEMKDYDTVVATGFPCVPA